MKKQITKKPPLENYQGKRREQYEFSATVAVAAAAGILLYVAIWKAYKLIIGFF
jgi:hypothetical protein